MIKAIDNADQVSARVNTPGVSPDLPLVELHRHLDGAIRVATILDLGRQHDLKLPADTVEGMTPFVHIDGSEPGLLAFLERFRYLVEVLVDEEACHRVAFENVEDAYREGLDHVELRFSPWFMAQRHGLDPQGVVEACVAGAAEASDRFGIGVGLIGILSRTYGPELCQHELNALLSRRNELVGIDLAGDEAGFPAVLFKKHFTQVRDAGLQVTVHAGEADGPQSVWSAIHDLGAQRIGHGFRAGEDPSLVDYLADQQIGLECCPTSNLHTSTVASYAEHPIQRLAQAGVRFCLNTDDPGISGITIGHEYAIAAPACGLDEADIRAAQRAAVEMSFIGVSQRRALLAKYETAAPGS